MSTLSPSGSPQTLLTVERALNLLELVGDAEAPLTVKQISVDLGLNITTSYHMTRTLLLRGYLMRNPDGTLTLGRSVRDLYLAFQRTFNIDERQTALITELARATSETSFFSVRVQASVVIKVLIEGSQTLRVSALQLGVSGREHKRASGKAVLAFLPERERETMLAAALRDEPEDQHAPIQRVLDYELDATRSRGWSLDDQESELGIASIGVPVFGPDSSVFGAVGVVTPAVRMQHNRSDYIAAARTTAEAMSALLGDTARP